MPAKRFTILIIPEGSHRVRRLGIKRSVVKGCLAGAAVLVLGLSVLVVDYVRTNLDRSELKRLQVENLAQRDELHQLVTRLEDLRKEIV